MRMRARAAWEIRWLRSRPWGMCIDRVLIAHEHPPAAYPRSPAGVCSRARLAVGDARTEPSRQAPHARCAAPAPARGGPLSPRRAVRPRARAQSAAGKAQASKRFAHITQGEQASPAGGRSCVARLGRDGARHEPTERRPVSPTSERAPACACEVPASARPPPDCPFAGPAGECPQPSHERFQRGQARRGAWQSRGRRRQARERQSGRVGRRAGARALAQPRRRGRPGAGAVDRQLSGGQGDRRRPLRRRAGERAAAVVGPQLGAGDHRCACRWPGDRLAVPRRPRLRAAPPAGQAFVVASPPAVSP
jgi:hypothetical protein